MGSLTTFGGIAFAVSIADVQHSTPVFDIGSPSSVGHVNLCPAQEVREGLRVHMISNNNCVLDTPCRVSAFYRPCGAMGSTLRLIASGFGGSIPPAAISISPYYWACGVMDSIVGFGSADPGSTPGTLSTQTDTEVN